MYKLNFRDLTTALTPWRKRRPKFLRFLYSLIKPLSTLNDNDIPIQYFDQGNTKNTTYKGIYSATSTYKPGDIVLYAGVAQRNKTAITSGEAFTQSKWVISPRTSLYQFTIFITRVLQVNSTKLILQKYLNELFDPTAQGIVITNNNSILHVKYKFNTSEKFTANYRYNNWKTATAYAASGDYVLAANGNVYESNTGHTSGTSTEPPHANWDLISTAAEYQFNNADEYTKDFTVEIPNIVVQQANYSNERFIKILELFNAAGKTYKGVNKDLSDTDPLYLLFEKN